MIKALTISLALFVLLYSIGQGEVETLGGHFFEDVCVSEFPVNGDNTCSTVDHFIEIAGSSVIQFDRQRFLGIWRYYEPVIPEYLGPPVSVPNHVMNMDFWLNERHVTGAISEVSEGEDKSVCCFGNLDASNIYVGTDLGLTNVSSVFHHLLSGQEGPSNEDHAYPSYHRHDARYYQHPERPQRHFSLGYEVLLGALVLVGGLYYATYAFRLGDTVKVETNIAYFLLGMLGIGAGLSIIIGYGFPY